MTEAGQHHRPRPRSIAIKMYLKDIIESEYHAGGKGKKNYIVTKQGERASRVHIMGTVVDVYSDPYGAYQFATIDDGTGRLQIRAFNTSILADADATVNAIVDVIGKPRKYGDEVYVLPEVCRVIEDPDWVIVRRIELAKKYGDNETLKHFKTVLNIKNEPTITETDTNLNVKKENLKIKINEEPIIRSSGANISLILGPLNGQATLTGERYPGDDVRSKRKLEEKTPLVRTAQATPPPDQRNIDKQRLLKYILENDEGIGVKYIAILKDLSLVDDYADIIIKELQISGSIYEPRIGRFKKVP